MVSKIDIVEYVEKYKTTCHHIMKTNGSIRRRKTLEDGLSVLTGFSVSCFDSLQLAAILLQSSGRRCGEVSVDDRQAQKFETGMGQGIWPLGVVQEENCHIF